MAWTYDTLLSAVTDYMDGQSDNFFGSVFPVCVRQAEERILHATKGQSFRRYATFTTNGTPAIGPYNDLMAPIAVYYNTVPLLNKEFSWAQEVFAGASGTPVAYCIRQRANDQTQTEVILVPTPPNAQAGSIEYFAKSMSLTTPPNGPGSSGTTWISENAENALLLGTLFHSYVYEKGEDDISNRYKEDFEKALALLKGFASNEMRRDEFRSAPAPRE